MKQESMRNTAVVFLLLAGALVILANGAKVKWQGLAAIVLLILLSFGVPVLGLVFSIPVFMLIFIRNKSALSTYWAKLANIKITNT